MYAIFVSRSKSLIGVFLGMHLLAIYYEYCETDVVLYRLCPELFFFFFFFLVLGQAQSKFKLKNK